MASESGLQLELLTALMEVDRVILDSPGIDRVVDVLIGKVRRFTGCDAAAIMLVDPDGADNARLYVSAGPQGATHDIERLTLTSATTQGPGRGVFDLDGATYGHPCIVRLAELGMKRMLLEPAAGARGAYAALALGFREARELPAVQVEVARAFAERLGATLTYMEREQRLYQQAYYDTLTGLPNRQLFRDRLDQQTARAARNGELLGLLYVDLDRFKQINDTLGHHAGDELLRAVGERLRTLINETDTIARLGGDEFAALLAQLNNPEAAGRTAERILAALEPAFRLRGGDYHISASVGVALFPLDGQTADELLRNADTAMYRAKRDGRNRIYFHEAQLNKRARERTHLESGLFRALREQHFTLCFQPQFELSGGALAGAEALIRWRGPEGGAPLPSQFMQVAEESGLSFEIGKWVLEELARQHTEWRLQGMAPSRLSLNVSAEQLRRREFVDLIRDALLRWDMPPWALELEFPESVLLGDLEATAGTLGVLADMGVRLAVDDFGTGLSSLSCLRHYPIHTVKIDDSLVRGLPQGGVSLQVAAAIVAMARSLGKQTVAEGVETQAQSECLRGLGCDFAQGYLFARPMPAGEFMRFMAAREIEPEAISPHIQQVGKPGR